MDVKAAEVMLCAAAHELKDGDVVLVGAGMPMGAAYLAQLTHAPNLTIVIELGVIAGRSERLPTSIADPILVENAIFAGSMTHILGGILPYVDIGFLGGAQVDRYGNINSTVIGDYYNPSIRLTGSGGANDIASIARRILIIMKHDKNKVVDKVDYITSVGYYKGGDSRKSLNLPGEGPLALITDLGVFKFDEETKEMYIHSYHPGVTVEKIKENTGFDIKVGKDVRETEIDMDEIKLLRKIDPKGIYLRY